MGEVNGEATGTTVTTDGAGNAADAGNQEKQGPMVPQSDVDRIVKERVARERAKYSDYDDLKSKAEGSKTLEDRLKSLEGELTATKIDSLRNKYAAEYGVTAEDRDLFLTGTDESTLEAQAKGLARRETDRKKQGNFAAKEGKTPPAAPDELRDFAKNLFNKKE